MQQIYIIVLVPSIIVFILFAIYFIADAEADWRQQQQQTPAAATTTTNESASTDATMPQCSSCSNSLESEEYISALGQEWHTECFRCSACDCQLSSWYFEKDGLLFCRDDYWQRFGHACQQCGAIITGPVSTIFQFMHHGWSGGFLKF